MAELFENDPATGAGVPASPVLALTLAQAIIEASHAPVILLDTTLNVVSASASFCHEFEIDPAAIYGKPIFDMGTGEWDRPQLRSLLSAIESGVQIDAYELDLRARDGAVRHLVLNAQRVDHLGIESTRILVAVADVTKRRAAEHRTAELLREKELLLREVQHRVANSLQIIAAVLLQGANAVRSEEGRAQLTDAHQRIMSVAAMERELANSKAGQVQLRPYLQKLCQSIGRSMIEGYRGIKLEVKADDSALAATSAASIGLIVTELVINALKHAFPAGRGGKILVEFQSQDSGWSLSIADDGIGTRGGASTAGLGTSIVDALAMQLGAEIQRTDAAPGVRVSLLVH